MRLLLGARSWQHDPHGVVPFIDGWLPYESLFPAVFGRPYQPQCQGTRGRFPRLQYRIPRTAGHVRIIKTYQGRRVTDIRIDAPLAPSGASIRNSRPWDTPHPTCLPWNGTMVPVGA